MLQLNFSARHDQAYSRLLKPRVRHPFHCDWHPVARGGPATLAWARMDMDLDADEALVEEIQTDWIREAIWTQKVMAACEKDPRPGGRYTPYCVRCLDCTSRDLARYLQVTLKPHMRVWDEAMLAATIWFLREEIGIRRIFYHTFEGGCQLKRITGMAPPRSVYTKPPRRFRFERTHQSPGFLIRSGSRKVKKLIRHRDASFYLLEFPTARS